MHGGRHRVGSFHATISIVASNEREHAAQVCNMRININHGDINGGCFFPFLVPKIGVGGGGGEGAGGLGGDLVDVGGLGGGGTEGRVTFPEQGYAFGGGFGLGA